MGRTCTYSVFVMQYCPYGSLCAKIRAVYTYRFIQLAVCLFRKEHCLLESSQASHVCPSRTSDCKWRWMWSIGGVILTGKTCYWPLVILYFEPILCKWTVRTTWSSIRKWQMFVACTSFIPLCAGRTGPQFWRLRPTARYAAVWG